MRSRQAFMSSAAPMPVPLSAARDNDAADISHPPTSLGFYSQAEVCALTTLSPVTIWRRIRDSEFPPSVRLSAKRVGWPRAKIHEWMRQREELADAS